MPVHEQLVQRIDLHELNAGVAENEFLAGDRADFFNRAVVAGVTIDTGVFQQRTVFADEGEIHAPGVDADAVDLQIPFTAGDAEGVLDVVEEAQGVPVEALIETHGDVGEAVDFFEREAALIERAYDGAAAFCSEIECQVALHSWIITLPTWSV